MLEKAARIAADRRDQLRSQHRARCSARLPKATRVACRSPRTPAGRRAAPVIADGRAARRWNAGSIARQPCVGRGLRRGVAEALPFWQKLLNAERVATDRGEGGRMRRRAPQRPSGWASDRCQRLGLRGERAKAALLPASAANARLAKAGMTCSCWPPRGAVDRGGERLRLAERAFEGGAGVGGERAEHLRVSTLIASTSPNCAC